jgi:ligand-binding sensor domain-containing protein
MSVEIAIQKETDSIFYFQEDWIERNNKYILGENALRGIKITSVETDSEHRVWVGTTHNGILRFDCDFAKPTPVLSNGIKCINDFELDTLSDRFYIATNNGLAIFNSDSHKIYKHEDGLADDVVTHLQKLDDGLVLATEKGLSVFDLQSLNCLVGCFSLSNRHVYCTESFNNSLYAGTLDGIKVINSGKLTHSINSTNSGLSHNWVSALLNFKNLLYIGTYGGGIFVLDRDNKVASLRGFVKPCEVNFNAMCTDGSRIYAGTLTHGVVIIDPANKSAVTITRGLPSLNVTAIDCDDTYLYAGTENGMTRILKECLIFNDCS